eukprot:CAMPEP_0180828756 /NCGR_PEP_ID=MMETSP1038_2-20121128/74860_1 /TAXON_ID=632150 /ORGANISM="Azadinium spinosum, Strain 3D9" /LENGTH=55 /DNA_ID=CAMNT_0022871679 /DNA_START=38 /DNA_END=202 /DNA_ORIENTATION=-
MGQTAAMGIEDARGTCGSMSIAKAPARRAEDGSWGGDPTGAGGAGRGREGRRRPR